MATLVLISYFSILGVLCVFGGHRFFLTHVFRTSGRRVPRPKAVFGALPRVTVQLPVFNERFVVERLIDAAAGHVIP